MKKIFLPVILLMIFSVVLSTQNMAASLGYGVQGRIERLEAKLTKASNTTRARNIRIKLDRIETKIINSNISYQNQRDWQDFRDDIQHDLADLEEDAKAFD